MTDYEKIIRNKMKLLKCVMCGSRNSLIPFTHSKLTTKKSFFTRLIKQRIQNINVPICKNCNTKIERYSTPTLILEICIIISSMFLLAISLGAILIYIISLGSVNYEIGPFIIILLFIGVVLLIILFIIIYIYNRRVDNPANYVKINENGSVSIKSEKSNKWIPYEDWIHKTLMECSNFTIFCKSCGKEIEKGQKICIYCGERTEN